jgi:futalosine hydrolase
MKILITAATDREMNFFRRELGVDEAKKLSLAVTGVGLLSTMYNLMKVTQESNPDIIIQLGIAGTFSNEIAVGKAFAVKTECTAEMGVWENERYTDIFEMGLAAVSEPPYEQKKLINPHFHLLNAAGVPAVNAITVNRITTNPEDISLYKHHYKLDTESMEGAALHYIGLSARIPFIQIRGISNLVGERNKNHWQIAEAMDSAVNACKTILTHLNEQP